MELCISLVYLRASICSSMDWGPLPQRALDASESTNGDSKNFCAEHAHMKKKTRKNQTSRVLGPLMRLRPAAPLASGPRFFCPLTAASLLQASASIIRDWLNPDSPRGASWSRTMTWSWSLRPPAQVPSQDSHGQLCTAQAPEPCAETCGEDPAHLSGACDNCGQDRHGARHEHASHRRQGFFQARLSCNIARCCSGLHAMDLFWSPGLCRRCHRCVSILAGCRFALGATLRGLLWRKRTAMSSEVLFLQRKFPAPVCHGEAAPCREEGRWSATGRRFARSLSGAYSNTPPQQPPGIRGRPPGQNAEFSCGHVPQKLQRQVCQPDPDVGGSLQALRVPPQWEPQRRDAAQCLGHHWERSLAFPDQQCPPNSITAAPRSHPANALQLCAAEDDGPQLCCLCADPCPEEPGRIA